jgi:predicted nuclease of restriction endonuclease-like (RecB) superfamily
MIDSGRKDMDLNRLVVAIKQAHEVLSKQACQAVNISLTLRNWLIGYYISEYELNGADRATYGEKVLAELASRLKDISNCSRRQLYRYLRFCRLYPQIMGTLPPQFQRFLPTSFYPGKVGTASPQSETHELPLLEKLSYSHIEQLVGIEDDIKRTFYQVECIRSNWSVRELKRQLASLYFERSGLSHNKQKLAELANQDAEVNSHSLTVRDPYVFEFLGLKPREVMNESHLEEQLINKLEAFLLELGHGFCFEARQKRILIGSEHFFIDLVFYHRILKCHVLVELKLEPFTHENIGQLNTYVSWYQQHIMNEGDNPPIGILLCTDKNQALAEYALAGMDNSLFVSKYLLELPKKEDMQAFIEGQVKEIGDSK